MASSSSSDKFSGKVVLVTGSNSGIGEGIALHYASRGAKVTLCGRDVTRLQEARAKCVEASGGYGDRFLSVPGDLTDQTYRKDIVQTTVDTFGKLDILVCNAGASDRRSAIDNTTEESFDITMNINVKAVFFLIQAALPYLEKSKGNVVTVSSMTTSVACSPNIVYPMTKAAIDHMTHCLALDLAPRGIRLNTVNPSFIPTRIVRGLDAEETDRVTKAFAALEIPKQPLGNRLLNLEELAESVAFLSSDAASFITGQNLVIDGARSLFAPYVTMKRPQHD